MDIPKQKFKIGDKVEFWRRPVFGKKYIDKGTIYNAEYDEDFGIVYWVDAKIGVNRGFMVLEKNIIKKIKPIKK